MVVVSHWLSFSCHNSSQTSLLCLDIAVLHPADMEVGVCNLWDVCVSDVLVQLAGS